MRIAFATVLIFIAIFVFFAVRKSKIESACEEITQQLVEDKILKASSGVSSISDPLRTFYYGNFHTYVDEYGRSPVTDGTCQILSDEAFTFLNIRKSAKPVGRYVSGNYELLRAERWHEDNIVQIWDRLPKVERNCPTFDTVSISPSGKSKIIEHTGCKGEIISFAVPNNNLFAEGKLSYETLIKDAGHFLGYSGREKPEYGWDSDHAVLVYLGDTIVLNFKYPQSNNAKYNVRYVN